VYGVASSKAGRGRGRRKQHDLGLSDRVPLAVDNATDDRLFGSGRPGIADFDRVVPFGGLVEDESPHTDLDAGGLTKHAGPVVRFLGAELVVVGAMSTIGTNRLKVAAADACAALDFSGQFGPVGCAIFEDQYVLGDHQHRAARLGASD